MGQGITNSILMMLVIMLSINVGLAFTQSAMSELNSPITAFHVTNSPLNNYYNGTLENGTSLINSNMLPSDNTIMGDTGNIFTDTYITLKSWVSGGVNSLVFLANVLVQPAGFLNDIGVPVPIYLSFQIIWSIIFIILITAWIMGRS